MTTTSSIARTTSRGRRFRSIIGGALAAVALTGVMLAASPAPAAQAATAYGQITVCWSTGGYAYTGNVTASKHNGSSWITTSTLRNASNGCRTWTTAGNTWFYFKAYQDSRVWTGTSWRGPVFTGQTQAIWSTPGYNTTVYATAYQYNY